jgi:hypothetical protein
MNPKIPHLLVSLAMIAVGIVPIIYWARTRKVESPAFLWGILAWILTVAIKFAVAIPLNQPFARLLALTVPSDVGSRLYDAYIGFLTAITECGILYVAIRFSSLRKYQFSHIIAFGIAFGAIEAILLGLRYGLRIALAESSEVALVPAAFSSIIERASTMPLHTLSCALIFFSIIARRPLLFWISFLAKGAVDGFASWLIYSHLTRNLLFKIILFSSYATMAGLSLIGLWWLNKHKDKLMSAAMVANGASSSTSVSSS